MVVETGLTQSCRRSPMASLPHMAGSMSLDFGGSNLRELRSKVPELMCKLE